MYEIGLKSNFRVDRVFNSESNGGTPSLSARSGDYRSIIVVSVTVIASISKDHFYLRRDNERPGIISCRENKRTKVTNIIMSEGENFEQSRAKVVCIAMRRPAGKELHF